MLITEALDSTCMQGTNDMVGTITRLTRNLHTEAAAEKIMLENTAKGEGLLTWHQLCHQHQPSLKLQVAFQYAEPTKIIYSLQIMKANLGNM